MSKLNSSETQHNPIRLAEVLAALSLATDLGTGKTMGHAIRSCYLGMQMACVLRLSMKDQTELYYSFLLMHSGCTVLSLGLAPLIQGDELAAIGDITLRDSTNPMEMLRWLGRNVAPDAPLLTRALHIIEAMMHSGDASEQLRGACEVAVRVAQRLGMPLGVQTALRNYQERWDGKGPFRLQGSEIPASARLLHAALKIEAFHSALGRQAAEQWAHEQNGKTLDPHVVEAFCAVAQQPELWETLARQDLWDLVLDLEPNSPYQSMDATKLDNVALAVADFVDLKSPFSVCHSRETAKIAEGIARRMGLSETEITDIRRAALVRDLGQVAVPSNIMFRHGQLNEGDQERLRLHPYYTERILARVPALATVATIAGQHHERLNGTGYYRGLSGNELSVSACILALADAFQERMQGEAGHVAPDPQAVLQAMQPELGTLFSPACFTALAQEFDMEVEEVQTPRKRKWPVGLTDREVEVLRLVATGATNRQIAQTLVISEKTVAHHLEHIYNKIGISSRAAAIYFGMEHELFT